ncbi:MAG: hypothetical protein IPH09_16515 [bacterium]|nr:hypothetical protein [bacterium]
MSSTSRNVHGSGPDWAYRAYAPWVEHVRHRADLTYVLDILGGETCIGHSFTGGGDEPRGRDRAGRTVGLRTLRSGTAATACAWIYTGENWNLELLAPLSRPRIHARVGDHLPARRRRRAHGGHEPRAACSTAGHDRQTVLTLND